MILTHGRGGQRFNSVRNSVRDLSNYRAAKQNRDLFRELHLIYEMQGSFIRIFSMHTP